MILKALILPFLFSTFLAPWSYASQAPESCQCSQLRQQCQMTATQEEVNRTYHCSDRDYQDCNMKPHLQFNVDSKTWFWNEDSIQQFTQALTEYKSEIMDLYKGRISSDEYDRLAIAALGILGAESKFFNSRRYLVKKYLPSKIRKLAKHLKRDRWDQLKKVEKPSDLVQFTSIPFYQCIHSQWQKHDLSLAALLCIHQSYKDSQFSKSLSNGPTQLKRIPKLIGKRYGVTERSLFDDPRHAAIATLGFLIEDKEYLFRLKNKYPSTMKTVSPEFYVPHLVYLYQGKGRRIVRGEVPSKNKNSYLQNFHSSLGDIQVQKYLCFSEQTAADLIER